MTFEKHAIGQSVARTEDPRLLRGDGRFTDDVNLPGQACAYVARSPFSHGTISTLDVETARAAGDVRFARRGRGPTGGMVPGRRGGGQAVSR